MIRSKPFIHAEREEADIETMQQNLTDPPGSTITDEGGPVPAVVPRVVARPQSRRGGRNRSPRGHH